MNDFRGFSFPEAGFSKPTFAAMERRGCRGAEGLTIATVLGFPAALLWRIGSFSASLISIFFVRFEKLRELRVSRWYVRQLARFRIIIVIPLF